MVESDTLSQLMANAFDTNSIDTTSMDRIASELRVGGDVRVLRPVVRSSDVKVQLRALTVLKRIGQRSSPLLPDLLELFADADVLVAYEMLQVVSVSATGEQAGDCWPILAALAHSERSIRFLAMVLLRGLRKEQLESVSSELGAKGLASHQDGVFALLREDERLAAKLMKSERAVDQRYAAVFAARASGGDFYDNPLAISDPDAAGFLEAVKATTRKVENDIDDYLTALRSSEDK